MGKNTTSTVISCRLDHEVAAALLKMAEARGMTMNKMLATMITRRVSEIRQKEGW